MKTLRIAICQINSTVGDLDGNSKKIIKFYSQAIQNSPDIIIFPECALPGYPPEDLLLREDFIQSNLDHLKIIANEVKDSCLIVGFIDRRKEGIYNSAAIVKNKKISTVYHKHSLPNYGVFDEKRYFVPGNLPGVLKINGIPIGISICEDIWENNLKINSCLIQAKKRGAKILINISASPYYAGRFQDRLKLLQRRVKQTGCPIVYVNMSGGQDELIFDGRSTVLDRKGHIVLLSKSFEEDLKFVDFEMDEKSKLVYPSTYTLNNTAKLTEPLSTGTEEIYQALVLGTRDYIEKNGFKSVLVGLSGGIDSSLVACIAVDAIGKERVIGVTMPSRYSSNETKTDALRLAENLGIQCLTIPIEEVFTAFLNTLFSAFKNMQPNIAEENIQSRIRGTILMALSNKFGHLVLTTGNKSEVSVGYCTLYGDTAGGFAVLKDVPKTVVYQLSKFVNKKSGKTIIPETVIVRAPTAELKPNQKDQDSLPPYDLLDKIIQGYVEEDKGFKELLGQKFPKEILSRVIKMIDANEYKRRQSPLGIKITPKSFGKDRRMPVTNRFTDREAL